MKYQHNYTCAKLIDTALFAFLSHIPERFLYNCIKPGYKINTEITSISFSALICITCAENAEMAFANYRLLQSFGLTIGFLSGTFLCVSFKLYILMILLVVAIMFYVLAEYKVRQVDNEVFEGSIEVN